MRKSRLKSLYLEFKMRKCKKRKILLLFQLSITPPKKILLKPTFLNVKLKYYLQIDLVPKL